MNGETITKGDFTFQVYRGPEVTHCPAWDGKHPYPEQLIVFHSTKGEDGLSWTSFEQFWADYGMVRMELSPAKLAAAAAGLANANDPIDKLKRQLNDVQDFAQDGLDDLVHDLASRIGSGVNNDGVDSQVQFIVEQVGRAQAIGLLQEILEKRPES